MDSKPPLSFRIFRHINTAALALPILIWGIALSIQWTTVPQMRLRLSTDVAHLSYALSIGNIGGVLGGIVALFADRYSNHANAVVGTALMIMAVCFAYYPLSSELWILSVVFFIFTFCGYLMQAASHSAVSILWGTDGVPIRFLIHVGFPIGTTLGPLMVIPFIDDDESTPSATKNTSTSLHWNESSLEQDVSEDTSAVENAFFIAAALLTLAAFIVFILQCFWQTYVFEYSNSENKSHGNSGKMHSYKEVISPAKWANGSTTFGVVIFISLVVLMTLEYATMKGTQEFLVTYLVDRELFTNKNAALLASITNGAGAFGRVVCFIASKFTSAPIIMIIAFVGQALMGVVLLVIGTQSEIAMWICAPLLGLFREPSYPSILAWTDYYIVLLGIIVGLSGFVVKLVDIGLLSLQGYLYDNTVIESIFYTTIGFGIALCLAGVVLTYYASRTGGRKKRELNAKAKLAQDETST